MDNEQAKSLQKAGCSLMGLGCLIPVIIMLLMFVVAVVASVFKGC